MKCYYDVLDVDRSVATDQIKKAYYKASLKWHPDKNIENASEATEMFQQIQQAYKVLSNPQERAWYDKNRERFLSMNFDSENDIYDIIENIIYKGFDDDVMGFFSVYRHVFTVLIKHETESSRIRGDKPENIPEFGDSKSSYLETVGNFYAFWEGFSTNMGFHWKNKHDIELSYPRDLRRAMEKENAEERNDARKSYNKTVRAFVETVKTKDPRVKTWKEYLSNKAKESEKKAIQMKHKAWERNRKKFSTNPEVVQSYGMSVEELEEILKTLEIDQIANKESDSEEEDLFCVPCKKYFKSIASYNNHTKSKNHRKNCKELKDHLKENHEELYEELLADDDAIDEEREENHVAAHTQTIDDIPEAKVDVEEAQPSSEIVKDGMEHVEKLTKDTESDIEEDVNELEVKDIGDKSKSTKSKKEKKRRRRPKEEKETEAAFPAKNDNLDVFICQGCSYEFTSKNKLFTHLKSSGHATIKSTGGKSKKI